jgi:hypothetical protein
MQENNGKKKGSVPETRTKPSIFQKKNHTINKHNNQQKFTG